MTKIRTAFQVSTSRTHLVRNSTVSRTKIKDHGVLGNWEGPVHARQESVVGGLGSLVDGIRRLAENSVVDVESATSHDILVKDSGLLVVVYFFQFEK